ncbi:hypothetical protein [Dinghuibacter silviterrae]|uniref:Uncharacterized protein n=1 Tax=Dinghuibacter silviterrae TaxID=1539049 RepID=A0A4R8DHL8_9BACT|nr:hypothetical protein [Dinghuibacter silviterrae]TDW97223.1 hypothetical protein EDB95_5068 [Dinghuibacter silviterrae]
MNFGNYIKSIVSDTVEGYRKWALPTFTVAFLFSLLTIIAAGAFYLKTPLGQRPYGLLDVFFVFYSPRGGEAVYSCVDLSRTAWIVCVAFFAIGWYRLASSNEALPSGSARWGAFIRRINDKDFWIILGVGAGLGVMDYLLVTLRDALEGITNTRYSNSSLLNWLFLELRLYLPPLIMAAVLKNRLFPQSPRWRANRWLYALAGIWLLEVVSSRMIWTIEQTMSLLSLASVHTPETPGFATVVVEYLIPAPVIAFFFVGFASVMIRPGLPEGVEAPYALAGTRTAEDPQAESAPQA